jgi:hypothetical protein
MTALPHWGWMSKCGSCRCGRCLTGAKKMTIKEEPLHQSFKELMRLDPEGTKTNPGPYWVSKLPWTRKKEDMISNRHAVLRVMNITKRKLAKNNKWKQVYKSHLLDLVEKGLTRELPPEELKNWTDKGCDPYYISHQMALNPGTKSTTVRVVFNSYRGCSLNSSFELGPDLMNGLHGVLLGFRKPTFAAQGDIRKMFYNVKKNNLCRFLWTITQETLLMNHYSGTIKGCTLWRAMNDKTQ